MQDILIRIAIALGLGLLVGLQRERKGDELAGIRTFGLISLAGALTGILAELSANLSWTIAAGALAIALMMAVGHFRNPTVNGKRSGLTTEIAAVVIFLLGAYTTLGEIPVAIVIGGTIALLLYWKDPLHNFVNKMGEGDVQSIMQFVLIALVILPILPNESMGPFAAFNPFGTWLVVVLVVGISLAGYVLYRLFPRAGPVLGGAVGGLISSTATTVSYARRTKAAPQTANIAAQAIMLANTVSFLRVIVLIAIFAPAVFASMVWPLGIFAGVMAILSFVAWVLGRGKHIDSPEQKNPAELTAALIFGALYALIKLATAWGKAVFGAAGLYVIAVISGLTDMDAITLSTSQMASGQNLDATTAWRIVLVAGLSNLLFKFGCIAALGTRSLLLRTSWLFALTFAAGVAILLLWPG